MTERCGLPSPQGGQTLNSVSAISLRFYSSLWRTITFGRPASARVALALLICLPSLANAQEDIALLEEVRVTATLLNEARSPVSATIFTERVQRQRGAAHLEDVISIAPNVAQSSGASRNRFFQIRGIGERSQFVEPINPSVGILIDGIDLSGAGGALTLYDLQQVEVLRGPQGTLMGANALAGLIALRSNPPDSTISDVSIGVENYGGRRLGLRLGGNLSDGLHARIAAQHYESDGFLDNQWLGRSDTNAREELTARGAVSWESASQFFEAAAYYTRVDNGYDAFSLDNTRATLSDQPGEDDLTLRAGRLNWQTRLFHVDSTLQISHASTDTLYSYDEDWSYVGIAPGWEYSSYDEYRRNRTMNSLEWRLQSTGETEWVVGTYFRDEAEDLRRRYTYLSTPFTSRITTETSALFGQVNPVFTERLSGFAGARLEHRDSQYRDSADVEKDFNHTYWTGRLGLVWVYDADQSLFITVSRGARAGGANASLLASIKALPEQAQGPLDYLGEFDEEELISTEIGWQANWPEYNLRSKLAVFTMDRENQQARGSVVIARQDGSTAFIDYTDNAAQGLHRGLEWEVQYQASDPLLMQWSIGLLEAQFEEYIDASGADLSNRDQPQSPDWQYSAGLTWSVSDLAAIKIEVTGSDSYFFSDRHNVRAPEAHRLNASLSGGRGNWRWTLWGRNLTNETTFTRGFGTFGNDPRKEYALEPYRQYGEPRIVGVTLSFDLTETMR